MLSAVGEGVQVALQAGTVAGKEKNSRNGPESRAKRNKADTVTLSPEAVQLIQAAVSATEKSHHEPQETSREGATEEPKELA